MPSVSRASLLGVAGGRRIRDESRAPAIFAGLDAATAALLVNIHHIAEIGEVEHP